MNAGTLCGLWIDDAGRAHVARAAVDGGRVATTEDFRPFAWIGEERAGPGIAVEPLRGEGAFRWLAHADSLPAFDDFFRELREGGPVDVLKPYESQWLLQRRERVYADLHFADLRRCQLDIETAAGEPGVLRVAAVPPIPRNRAAVRPKIE